MDVTIEVWSGVSGLYFAECTCGKWVIGSTDQAWVEQCVSEHKAEHTANGDFVEVV